MEQDVELIALSANDPQAFAKLVHRHRDFVFCLAVSILGREFDPEAEDITQEVFLKVHRSMGSFRRESEFRSWLYRITFNQAVNLKTRVRYRKPHADESAMFAAITSEPGPDQQAENTERDRVLAACIQTLPDVYQSALRLYYWLGRSVADIAEVLDVPENTVKSYLHRARGLLQNMLKERGYSCD